MGASRILPILAVAALAGFCVGLVRLFQLRFEAGDVYPAYSSLRSDPLGAKVLYRSLEEVGLAVHRSYRPFSKMADTGGTTLLLLGLDRGGAHLPEREAEALERIADRGGRVVLCFRPDTRRPRGDAAPSTDEGGAPSPEPAPSSPSDDGEGPERGQDATPREPEPWNRWARIVSLGNRWGFAHGTEPLGQTGLTAKRRPEAPDELRAEIPWRSLGFFKKLSADWRTVYARDGRPVVAERRFGDGTIVLFSESYLASNEALWRDRLPELLAWIVGPALRVVFDETHLGVVSSPGIASLARRYRLHGFGAGLALLFGLILWRNRARGGSRRESPEGLRPAAGQDAATGLALLLRRNVPPGEILTVCLGEWEKTGPKSERTGEDLRRIREILDRHEALPSRRRDPAATYRVICEALAARPGFSPETAFGGPRRPLP